MGQKIEDSVALVERLELPFVQVRAYDSYRAIRFKNGLSGHDAIADAQSSSPNTEGSKFIVAPAMRSLAQCE